MRLTKQYIKHVWREIVIHHLLIITNSQSPVVRKYIIKFSSHPLLQIPKVNVAAVVHLPSLWQ